jgi:hypothetical protein
MTDAVSYVSVPNEPAMEPAVPRALVADWPTYGGNASRTGQGVGGEFKLEPAWRQSTVLAPESGSGDARAWAEDMINNIEKPGNLIFANGQVISQTVDGIAAYPLVKK